MVEAGVFGKKAIEHGAQQKCAGAFERLLVNSDGDLDSACHPDAAALADTPHDWTTIDVTNATDAAKPMFHQRKPCSYISMTIDSVLLTGPPRVITYGSGKSCR